MKQLTRAHLDSVVNMYLGSSSIRCSTGIGNPPRVEILITKALFLGGKKLGFELFKTLYFLEEEFSGRLFALQIRMIREVMLTNFRNLLGLKISIS